MKLMMIQQQHKKELKNRSASYRHKQLIRIACKIFNGHVVKEKEDK